MKEETAITDYKLICYDDALCSRIITGVTFNTRGYRNTKLQVYKQSWPPGEC